MAFSEPGNQTPPRVLRMFLCGHVGTGREDFAYMLGPCFDALLRGDIKIEITEVTRASQLLEALEHVEHDFVMLMFNPCILACETAQLKQSSANQPDHTGSTRTSGQWLPRGCDYIRLVRERTLKPIFVIQSGGLLAEFGRHAVMEAGADLIMNMPFSAATFEKGLRRFLHRTAFKDPPVRWPAPADTRPRVVAPVRRFQAVSAIHAPAIRHTLFTCVRAIEVSECKRYWCDIESPLAEEFLEDPALEKASLVVVQLNNLEYPEDFGEVDRYMWFVSELRARTAGFILTLNGHWNTPEGLFATEVAGADLALSVPFDIAEVFEAVRSAHEIWASGR